MNSTYSVYFLKGVFYNVLYYQLGIGYGWPLVNKHFFMRVFWTCGSCSLWFRKSIRGDYFHMNVFQAKENWKKKAQHTHTHLWNPIQAWQLFTTLTDLLYYFLTLKDQTTTCFIRKNNQIKVLVWRFFMQRYSGVLSGEVSPCFWFLSCLLCSLSKSKLHLHRSQLINVWKIASLFLKILVQR